MTHVSQSLSVHVLHGLVWSEVSKIIQYMSCSVLLVKKIWVTYLSVFFPQSANRLASWMRFVKRASTLPIGECTSSTHDADQSVILLKPFCCQHLLHKMDLVYQAMLGEISLATLAPRNAWRDFTSRPWGTNHLMLIVFQLDKIRKKNVGI